MSIPGFAVIDLTHPIHEGMNTQPGVSSTRIERQAIEENGNGSSRGLGSRVESTTITIADRTGTHCEVVSTEGTDFNDTTERLSPEQLISPLVVFHCQEHVAQDEDFKFTAAHLEEWEAQNGQFPVGAVACLDSGWSRNWGSNTGYFHAKACPGFADDAIEMLLEERGALGIGTDTPPSSSRHFHELVHSEDIQRSFVVRLENLKSLDRMPARGGYLFIGVLAVRDQKVSPARVLGLYPGSAPLE